MKNVFLTCFCILFVFLSFGLGQQFIGKTGEEIRTLMQQSEKGLSFTKEVNTDEYHYLKFENEDNTKTKLFILSDEGVCEYTRLMCDYSLLRSIIDSLNEHYQYRKDQTWIDYASDEEHNYLIELKKRDWFFTIKTSRIKR